MEISSGIYLTYPILVGESKPGDVSWYSSNLKYPILGGSRRK